MKTKSIINYILSMVILLIVVISCSESEKGTAKIQVTLIDAPADYDAVLIDIQDVQINVNGEEGGENGWQSLESATPGVYDLLKLTNGEEQFLGEIELPEGKLGQIRLILGNGNILTIEGENTPLTVPSGSQSGLKIKVDADILAGVTYKLVIDFDAAKSVVKAGNSGKYNLKPVIRAKMEAATGAIHGTISPVTTSSVVYAIINEDSVSSYPDENGEFLIRALTAGSYTVSAVPDEASGLITKDLEAVVVVGEVTEAGTIEFGTTEVVEAAK